MQHRTVFEVMTHDVVTVGPTASFKEVARLFHDHDISAVPVVDASRRVLGVVSEADLLRSTVGLPDLEGRGTTRPAPGDREPPEAETAAELMTAPALTAQPTWNLVETARTMHGKGVKRLPVADETGQLVGIVSRSDLLRPFLRRDSAIREEIEHDVLRTTLRLAPDEIHVRVHDGVVTLTGRVEERGSIPVLERLCRSVDGVVALHESVGYTYDNLGLDVEPPR
ncbi:CBS domain-containing protein [Streptomyces sp. NPDC006296]|uniref:CBS domain-containing protein n=1 Tax=Streptomyces sp. NPDC006296 TaxID=3156746 RepID=UPI0033B63768